MSIDLLSAPFNAASVTPNDTTDLSKITRALNVSGDGAVAIITASGDEVTLYIAAGIVFPINASRIKATGTTATGIVALW